MLSQVKAVCYSLLLCILFITTYSRFFLSWAISSWYIVSITLMDELTLYQGCPAHCPAESPPNSPIRPCRHDPEPMAHQEASVRSR